MSESTVFVALLRGINVGGQKRIIMSQLRVLLSSIGLERVETYIQSGNILFKSTDKNKTKIESRIHNTIKFHFGFDVPVIVKTRNELSDIFNRNPFAEEIKKTSYFAILSKIPDSQLVESVSKKAYEDEEYQIIEDCIYLYCANGYGRAKFNLNYFEKKLNVSATARNYKTMVKLLSLTEDN